MNIQELIELYQDGVSLNKLSNKYDISVYRIKSILINNNITIRTRSQQNILSNQDRGKKVNHQYFDEIDSDKKAYILGFLAADGCIFDGNRNSISIGLSRVDREILEKIQAEIESERDIYDFETNDGYQVSRLVWSSANHKIQLAKQSIVPNKTMKKITMQNIPKELQLSFLLGYYDGDGCFRDDGTTCRFEICSFNEFLLQEFADLINEKFNTNIQVHKDKSRKNYYTLTYSTKIAEPLLKLLYKTNSLYLERKYNKFQNWLKSNNRI